MEAGIGQCGHLNIGGGGGCEEGSGAACVEVWSKQHRKDAQDVWLKNSLGRAWCLECVRPLVPFPAPHTHRHKSSLSSECSVHGCLAL